MRALFEHTWICRLRSCAVGLLLSAGLCGCGDFFDRKPTELEADMVLKELNQVRESPYISNPLPDVYRQPPSRVAIDNGIKVFYFAKQHPVSRLTELLTQQMALKVAPNPATNQMVIFCKDDAQADKAIQYLDMVDVPPVQVNIDCLILERFGDITMDWESTVLVENLLGEEIFLGSVNRDGAIDPLNPAFPGASLREQGRGDFGFDLGVYLNRDKPGHRVRAVVDTLISRGYLKVLLNPSLETVNGQSATVTIQDYVPTEKISTGGGNYDAYNITEYIWVQDTLTVLPVVYADGSVGLTTSIKIGSSKKPEGVTQAAIITERSINVQENRVQAGNSLIIGGMRKSEKRSVIRGAPFLKDLPIIGILFSSKDFEEKATEIFFILTPSVSSGSRDHNEVAGEIRTRFADPDVKQGVKDWLTDPLGGASYASIVEKEAVQAEMGRVSMELKKQEAQTKLAAERQRYESVQTDAARLRQYAQQCQEKADKAVAEAQKAAQNVIDVKSVADARSSQAARLEQEKLQAEAEAQKAAKTAADARVMVTEAEKNAAMQESRTQQAQIDAQTAVEAARKAAAEALDKEQKAEQERRIREEAIRKAKEEAQRKAEEEARRKAQEEAARKAQQADPNSPAAPDSPLPAAPKTPAAP